MTFGLAPMSPSVRALTWALLPLPALFLAIALTIQRLLLAPAAVLVLIDVWIWLWWRPTAFVIEPHALQIVWPLRRRAIPRADLAAVRLIDRAELRREVGKGLRVGAGGMWGGFGWLWTERRGALRMYVSRTDQFVWIERRSGRPWLITPERPADFVRALSG
jgi:hypothetical protein